MWMERFTELALGFALAKAAASSGTLDSDTTGLRGVGPEYAKYFKDSRSFACIFNPSIKLEASQVNDDFCDCPDGSDEPGTSACTHLSSFEAQPSMDSISRLNHSFALPGYYCANKGHDSHYISFSYVNDGICDYELCCDGSDEYEGVNGIKCEDKCQEIGLVWKKQREAKAKSRSLAAERRKELVITAARLRMQIEERIRNLKIQLQATEVRIKDGEAALADAQKTEKLRTIRAPKEGGKLGVLVALARDRLETLKQGLNDVLEKKTDSEVRVSELEGILEKFKSDYNPNFNDEGVKRAVKAWEEYEARGRAPSKDYELDNKVQNLLMDEAAHGIIWEDYETLQKETDSLYNLLNYLPPSLRDWLTVKLADLKSMLVDNGVLPRLDSDSSESKVLQNARDHLDSVRSELDTTKTSIETEEAEIGKTYGIDDVFRALKSECISVDSGEYTYEHCFLQKTTQKSNKGGGDTNMGYFDRIETINVDEDEPVNGKGLGSGERLALRYDNGAHCWNGPARSTIVILACAETNEIWRVSEEEKCAYRIEAGSPAACEPLSPQDKARVEKDEL